MQSSTVLKTFDSLQTTAEVGVAIVGFSGVAGVGSAPQT